MKRKKVCFQRGNYDMGLFFRGETVFLTGKFIKMNDYPPAYRNAGLSATAGRLPNPL
jgi:hypothetical protein